MTKSFAILLGVVFAASARAQDWPLPASTPNTPVKCSTSCPSNIVGKPTPGWSEPVVAFTGRFVDSAYQQDWQQTFRTARAGRTRTNPAGTRIYVALGNAVAAYDASTFFSRLEAHEPLLPATSVPVNPPNRNTHPPPVETFLNFDQFFYAENTPSEWVTPPADGQDRLFDFDVDDRGIVYIAYSMFGWGTAKDTGASTRSLMVPSYQNPLSLDYSPRRVFWVKSLSGSYYAFVGKPSSPTLVFNVDDYLNPTPRGTYPDGYVDFARGGSRTAVVNDAGALIIYDNDALISGGAPLTRQTPASGYSSYLSAVFDGTNFWAAAFVGATYSGLLSKYAPNASGSYTRTDYPLCGPNDMCQVMSMRFRDGYIGMGVATMGGTDQRLYKISSGTPVEYPLNGVFLRYYSSPPAGFIRAPRSSPGMVIPWVRNGKLYVVIPASGLGDVWQLRNDDSLSVVVQGTAGGVNPNAPTRNPGDIFYGDKVAFLASTSGATAKPIQWNFGSPRPANDLSNTAQGSTGATTHQYTGLARQDIVAPLTVTATDTTTGTTGSVSLQMKAPTVAFGFGNSLSKYKYLFAQANASSPAPIVADDSFFDASDGDLSGHFDGWGIGPDAATVTSSSFVPQYAAPGTSIPVGGCGTHTLALTGHYGAYTTMAPSNPDFAVGLTPVNGVSTFTYTVQPFAASVDFSADDVNNQLIFTSTSRSAAAIASSAVTYKWDIVKQVANQADTVVVAGLAQATAASLATIPNWPVARSVFTTSGLRARLIISMTGASAVCAGASASQTAYSAVLPSLPDAVLNVGTCNSTGCSYSVTSPTGAMTRDGWTFVWSASGPASPNTSSTSTFAPVFTTKGTYTVSVKVTNSIGSVTLTSPQHTTTANASTCPTMVENSNVYITGAGANCRTDTGSCTSADFITLSITFWTYQDTCATHTYSWVVDGANAGTTKTVSRTLGTGSHTVACTVNNGSQTITLQQTFTVQSSAPPPPPPPLPTSCSTLVANSNVFISFSGQTSGCSDRAGTCSTSEAISLGVNFWGGYNQSCATHTYSWHFDDGTNLSGQSVSKVLTAGTHIVTCTVSNGSQSVPVSATVTVAGGPPPPPLPPPVNNTCGTLTANGNVFMSYTGPASGCRDGGNCAMGEAIAFSVAYWQFSPSCAATYAWQFDGGGTATGQNVTHAFTTTGQHTATCTITYGTQTLPLSTTLNVGGNPATPAPTVTVAVEYVGASTYRFTPTVTSGTVTKFLWDFGDGTTVTTTEAKPVQNMYAKVGMYTVTLTVQSNGPGALFPMTVNVVARSRPVGH